MAVQASLVWPKIDEILEFEDFSDRFFSYHPVVPWNDGEALPATQGIDLHIACGLCAGIKPVQGVVIKHF